MKEARERGDDSRATIHDKQGNLICEAIMQMKGRKGYFFRISIAEGLLTLIHCCMSAELRKKINVNRNSIIGNAMKMK